MFLVMEETYEFQFGKHVMFSIPVVHLGKKKNLVLLKIWEEDSACGFLFGIVGAMRLINHGKWTEHEGEHLQRCQLSRAR